MDVVGMIKRTKGALLYTITRTNGTGSYDQTGARGVFVPGTTETLQIWGSKQPLGFKDIESIPEGDRTKESHRFYSFPDLRSNDTQRMAIGDTLPINESTFRVVSIAHWPNHSLAIVVKENTGDN